MKRHSAWAVAAAVLILEEEAMHYTTIADRVIQSDLSGLSDDGGSTPSQTIGAAIRSHSDIFQPDWGAGAGYYYVLDEEEALQNVKVKAAFESLRNIA